MYGIAAEENLTHGKIAREFVQVPVCAAPILLPVVQCQVDVFFPPSFKSADKLKYVWHLIIIVTLYLKLMKSSGSLTLI